MKLAIVATHHVLLALSEGGVHAVQLAGQESDAHAEQSRRSVPICGTLQQDTATQHDDREDGELHTDRISATALPLQSVLLP